MAMTNTSLISRPMKTDKEPPFLKIYLTKLLALQNLPDEYSVILYEMLHLMCRKTNIVYLAQHNREVIAEKLGIKANKYVIAKLNKMVDLNIIAKHTRGSYIINTDYVGGLNWEDFFVVREKYYYLQARFDTDTGEVFYSSGYAKEVEERFALHEAEAKRNTPEELKKKKIKAEKVLKRYYKRKRELTSSIKPKLPVANFEKTNIQ
jgi:hypothetical protein